MKRIFKKILVLLPIILLFWALQSIFAAKTNNSSNSKYILRYDELINKLENDEVESITITEPFNNAKVIMTDGESFSVTIPSLDNFSNVITEEIQSGNSVEFKIIELTKIERVFTSIYNIFLKIFEFLLIIGFIVMFFSIGSMFKVIDEKEKKEKKKKNNDNNTSNTDVDVIDDDDDDDGDFFSELFFGGDKNFGKKATSTVKFDDVAGIDEEKEQLQEIVEFLKNPKKYEEMGAKVPKGVLLTGPPGTGKTLLAQAIAGEAGVPFYQVTGSDFDEKFVGVGSSRVRSIFKKAKKNAPSIIFIDEFDTVAQKRYTSRSYSEQTLNQLLAEMAGFECKEGVIVIAATNYPEVLDKAVTRPGRFDRKISIPMPDVVAREKILMVHAKTKKLSKELSLKEVAAKTVGFSGADLKNLLNESAILAVNRNAEYIESEDIEEAFARVIVGLAKKNKKITPEMKYAIAIHESGHAIVSMALRKDAEFFGISIVPRGDAGGYNLFYPNENSLSSKDELLNNMSVAYGGKAAEELILNMKSSGPSEDLENATKLVYAIVNRYAMDDSLLTLIGNNEFDSILVKENMQKAEKICEEVYKKTKEVLTKNEDVLLELAKLLMQKENLNAEEVKEFRQTHEIIS